MGVDSGLPDFRGANGKNLLLLLNELLKSFRLLEIVQVFLE